MTEVSQQDLLALKKFGLNVHENQRDQVLKQIRSSPAIKQEFQKIKLSLKTMLDEDLFLETINASHQKISEIPENTKVIQVRDGTFVIRAINPQQIESLTERAFFNSFSLQRIMMKNIQSEENKKFSQQKQEKKQEKQVAPKDQNQDLQKCNCICGKIKQKQTAWIQCANEGKCRGSSWYHIQCSGLVDVNLQELQNLNYICMYCKRGNEEDGLSSDPLSKKIKKN